MAKERKKQELAACPNCGDEAPELNGTEDVEMTIVCECGNHYNVNLTVSEGPHGHDGKQDLIEINNKTHLPIKLACPIPGCKYYIRNKNPSNTIVSVKCPRCNRFFIANLRTGTTEQTPPHPNAG